MRTRHCPECQAELKHKSYKVFHCWICPEGHGTLYPKGELEQIVKALSGLGDLEMAIWNDHEHYSVISSNLVSPDSGELLLEIRDKAHMSIVVYGDPETQSLWVHVGEEEKLLEHIKRESNVDSVSSYVKLAAEEAAGLFDDEQPITEATGHFLTALKLLGERIVRSMPHITI